MADGASYSDITVEDGATLESPVVLSGDDTLIVEFGGTVDQLAGSNTRPVTIDGPTTGVAIDNSGLIDNPGYRWCDRLLTSQMANPTTSRIWNRESGVISMTYDNGTVVEVSGGQQDNGGAFDRRCSLSTMRA